MCPVGTYVQMNGYVRHHKWYRPNILGKVVEVTSGYGRKVEWYTREKEIRDNLMFEYLNIVPNIQITQDPIKVIDILQIMRHYSKVL